MLPKPASRLEGHGVDYHVRPHEMRATHGWTLSTVQGQSANEKRGEGSRLTGHEMPVTAPTNEIATERRA